MIVQRKRKKLRKLLNKDLEKMNVALQRYGDHLECFDFKASLTEHGRTLDPDMENLINLIDISSPSIQNSPVNSEKTNNENLSSENNFCFSDIATEVNGRLKGVYVSKNVFNLSKRVLTEAEVSLLSKGLKFVPTPRSVDRAALKHDLEQFGRKLRLAWHFRNDEREFVIEPFKKRSNFNPKKNDAAIELYMSRIEEEILKMDTRICKHNVTKEERRAIDSLRNDSSIIIKGADKGSCVVVWDREDYLKEAGAQLSDEKVYERQFDDPVGPLVNVIKSCIDNIDKRGDISRGTLDYFLVNNPKLGRFLQGISDHYCRFTDAYIGWAGCIHDARVYANSPIGQEIDRNPQSMMPGNTHLVDDAACALTGFMMVSYKDNG